MSRSWLVARSVFLTVIMLGLPSVGNAQQTTQWTEAQCRARWEQLMEMMRKASDPKASDSKVDLSELKKAVDDLPRSSFAKYCLREALSLKALQRWAEDIEANRQETAGADSTTERAGKKFEEATKQNSDAGYTKF